MPVLADPGYEGAGHGARMPAKKPAGSKSSTLIPGSQRAFAFGPLPGRARLRAFAPALADAPACHCQPHENRPYRPGRACPGAIRAEDDHVKAAGKTSMTDRVVLAARVSAPGCHVCLAGGPTGQLLARTGFAGSPETKFEPSLHPAGERIIGRIAFRLDAYEAGQSPAGEQHRPHVRLRSACSRLSAPTRTISVVPVMPPHILPLTRKDRPQRTPRTTLSEPHPTPGSGQKSIRVGPVAIAARRGARTASRGARRAGPPARRASPPAVPGPHLARCAGS